MIIKEVVARKILNSRREETISVTVETTEGKFEVSAPGGKSRGKNEAQPFSKKGIEFSIKFVNVLGKKLVEDKIVLNDFLDLEKIEGLIRKADKTKDFSVVGANAIYALEAAVLKAIAASYKKSLWNFLNEKPKLPKPLGNCIGGGKHITQDKKTDFQEFLFLPQAKSFFDASYINLKAYQEAKKSIFVKDKDWRGSLTDESAIASTLDNESIIYLLSDIVKKVKKDFNINIALGLDAASSSFWNGINYSYKNMPGQEKFSQEQQIEYMAKIIEQNNLVYVEDPLQEEDFEGFARLLRIVKKKNPKCLIVGDDLICTQFDRLKKAIKMNSINAVIIKPNQNGSLIETKRVVDLAHDNNITTIISHRSGETVDNTIAHLAVGWNIPIIKTGILGRERVAKLNELSRIERSLGINNY